MAKKRKRKEEEVVEEEQAKPDTFIVGYASLATIILAFFICMCSMATIQEERVKKGLLSVKSSFGVLGGYETPMEGETSEEEYLQGVDMKLLQSLKEFLGEETFGRYVHVGLTGRGYLISLGADLLFPSGSYRLKEDSKAILDRIVPIVKAYRGKVRIEGYTDSLPPKGGDFSHNWDLSMKRALFVEEYFVAKGVPRSKFEVAGYGAGNPLFPNDTPEHRKLNRRVWILLKKPEYAMGGGNVVGVKGFLFKVREFGR